jgi:hypothetical protein
MAGTICGHRIFLVWTLENPMKAITAALIATTMSASAACADPAVLAPGKPAGVHNAQMGSSLLILTGIGIAAVGIALAVSAGNAHGPTTATTTATGTA